MLAGDRLKAVRLMSQLFSGLTGIDDHSTHDEDDRQILLASGTAVSPKIAARCLLDIERTTAFLRALERGIREMRRRYPGEIIDVLYAGCGPYATLAVPLCTRFSPEEVRFTLLDIHERSLNAARTMIEWLGYGDFVRGYVNCDAASYRHPDRSPIHLVVSEVMQNSLAKEPQFAVTANLAPQMIDGGIFIPKRISVEFCIADIRWRPTTLPDDGGGSRIMLQPSQEKVTVAKLLDLSAKEIPALLASIAEDGATGILSLPAVVARIPELPQEASTYVPIFRTTIELTDAIMLDNHDSGLTIPRILANLDNLRGGELMEFRYLLGANPGFIYRRLGEEPGIA